MFRENVSRNLISPEKLLCELLLEKGLKVSTAESCTGGLIASKITSVSGASGCFDLGVVTYSNEQKQKILGVKGETLEKYGAVSEETALEMCKGVIRISGADIGISVTGIAGPTGGTAEKPVGTVWIGICSAGIHKAECFHFDGDRDTVRECTVNKALEMVLREI